MEIPELQKKIDQLKNSLDFWLYLFKNTSMMEESDFDILRDKYPTMEDAIKELDLLSQSAELQAAYTRHIMEKADYASGMNSSYRKGLAQGRQQGLGQGLEQSKLEVAKKMLEKGISRELALEITGLEEKDLQEAGVL